MVLKNGSYYKNLRGSEITQIRIDDSKVIALGIPGQAILNDPKALFSFLTQYTVPHGYERLHYGRMLEGLGFVSDSCGNWYKNVLRSNGSLANTAFMCHTDTACEFFEKVRKVKNGHIIQTDGKTILGADDRAGMTVLLYLANKKVPGLYCLFVGEEVGCVGSKYAAKTNKIFDHIKHAVSFDRRGTTSIITHQCGVRCCSKEFSQELSIQFRQIGLTLIPDSTGTFTDSMEFIDTIPECTNLSVGYRDAHSTTEMQNIKFLENLCEACLDIDWEDLPVTRDPAAYTGRFWEEDDDDYEYYRQSHRNSSHIYHVQYGEDNKEEDFTLEKMRAGITIDLHELYGFVLDQPDEAVLVIDKLLRGYHPSNL